MIGITEQTAVVPPPVARMLTNEQARAYCGIGSERAFYDFRKAYGLKVVPVLPQTYRYDVRDLDAALDRAREGAVDVGPKPGTKGED